MGAEKDPPIPPESSASPELRRLLDQEAARSDPPAALRAQVRAQLAESLQRPVVAPRRLPLGGGRLWAAIAAAGAAAVVTAVVVRSPSQPRLPPAPAPAPVVVPAAPPAVENIPGPAPEVKPSSAPAPETPAARPKAPRSGAPEEPSLDTSLARERRLIERAREQLRTSHPGAALGILREHARAFPRGILLEERLGLEIQALAASGEVEPARQRAREFRTRFPQSPLLPAVDAALGRGSP